MEYTFDEVLRDMLEVESLLPYLHYDDFKDDVFYFKYSELYPIRLSSNLPLKAFQSRVNEYMKANNKLSIRYYIAIIKIKINKTRNSLKYKKVKSIILHKQVKVKEDHWTI